jgi:hypothetical protein
VDWISHPCNVSAAPLSPRRRLSMSSAAFVVEYYLRYDGFSSLEGLWLCSDWMIVLGSCFPLI